MQVPARTPDELLAIKRDRVRVGAPHDDDHELIWEMFTAMWAVMAPVVENIQYITTFMRATIAAIVLTGKIAGAGTAIGLFVGGLLVLLGVV